MRQLENKITEARAKKNMYVARARSAQASEKLQDLLGNMKTGSAMGAFERMEDKVMQLEAKSQAIAELGGDDLEKKFASLEGGNDIDAELEAMKAQMLPGGTTKSITEESSAEKKPEIGE